MRFVIDASCLVASLRPGEPHYADSRALVDAIITHHYEVCLPTIALAEVSAAIARASGSRQLAGRLSRVLLGIPCFRFVAVDLALARQAADMASEHHLRGHDAVYVALAAGCDATLVSLDNEQLQRVPDGLVAMTLGDALLWLMG